MDVKLVYIGQHYLVLLLCITSCWGLGQALLPKSEPPTVLNALLALAVGMGGAICALQAMAILGALKAHWIFLFVAVGLIATTLHWVTRPPHPVRRLIAWWSSLSAHARGSVLLLGIFFSSTLLLPLSPPLGWDENMYHLPHARAWAESGSLDIHGWLRYPWFPFNLDLPFAAALLLYDDVFAHLLGALPGWICAGLLFQIALRFTSIPGASIATILWLQASRDQYDLACVDLGATLFVFAAYAAYLRAKESIHKSHGLVASAFLMGVACGGKYQTLSFVPLLVLGVWFLDKTPATVVKSIFALLLPCSYWYLRNALMTGDPFQPLGGKIFGFTEWNLADYQAQFADLKRHAGWPEWYLWSLLLIPLWSKLRKAPHMVEALIICAYSIAFWLATSHYPRYLLPLYPLLCILSVVAWGQVFQPITTKFSFLAPSCGPQAIRYAWLALLVPFASVLIMEWTTELKQVSPTEASREALLSSTIASYDALSYVNNHPTKKIYQIGLDSVIYFCRKPLYGDSFGPWRFADFVELPAQEFANKLVAHGFDTFISHNRPTEQQPDFNKYFSPVFSRNGVTVYRVQSSLP